MDPKSHQPQQQSQFPPNWERALAFAVKAAKELGHDDVPEHFPVAVQLFIHLISAPVEIESPHRQTSTEDTLELLQSMARAQAQRSL